jgi:hypothetical protein
MAEDLGQLKLCELRVKGLMEEIDRRSTNPSVICGKCGAKANDPKDLHNPRPLAKRGPDTFWG